MTALLHSIEVFGQYPFNDYRHIMNGIWANYKNETEEENIGREELAPKKSAAEVLEETKPFYVRSPSALKTCTTDKRRPDDINRITKISPNKKQDRPCDLETKLRRLFDSKESLGEDFCYKTEVQYKSLPDLSTSSHESFGSTLHHISCSGDEIFSKAETSSTLDTGSSSEQSYGKPPSLTNSYISMGGSAGKVESKIWRKKEITANIKLNRSKSDPGETKFTQEFDIPDKLQGFFQYLGLSSQSFRKLTTVSLNGSNPTYFPSGDSTGSTPKGRASSGCDEETVTDMGLSIVERNARVIKWLVACAKS